MKWMKGMNMMIILQMYLKMIFIWLTLPLFDHHKHVVHQGSSPTPEAIVKKRKQSNDYVQFGFSFIQCKEFLYLKYVICSYALKKLMKQASFISLCKGECKNYKN